METAGSPEIKVPMYQSKVSTIIFIGRGVPQLRWVITSLSLWKPKFSHKTVHVAFVDKVALGYGFVALLQFSFASTIPQMLHPHNSSIEHHHYDTS
jgi:hypothetical protein